MAPETRYNSVLSFCASTVVCQCIKLVVLQVKATIVILNPLEDVNLPIWCNCMRSSHSHLGQQMEIICK